MEVASVGRQVGLGLVGPEGVEALGDVVFAHHIPVPARGVGIGGVDIGAGAIVGEAVGGRAIGQVHKPAVVEDGLVVAVLRDEARPHADHGVEAHRVQLAVHADRVRPFRRVHVQLAHFGVMEPVDDQHICRQMAIAIALRYGHQLGLAGVALLRLDVTVGGLRQHGDVAGK